MRPNPTRQLDHLGTSIFHLLEIHKRLGAIFLTHVPPLVASVDYQRPQTHGHGQLHGLDADAAATAGEDSPLPGAQTGGFDRGVGCAG